MSEQDMSGQQAGQGWGGPGPGRAAEGQPGPDTMYRTGLGQAPGWAMHHAPYGAPVMPPPFMFQAPPYPAAHGVPYGWPPMAGHAPAMGPMAGQAAGGRPGLGQVMEEIANGGSGLAGLTKLLDLDDKDFWKGALVGAAAVLLLTNENIQKALFHGAVKGRDAVQEGVEKVKSGADTLKQAARDAKTKADEQA